MHHKNGLTIIECLLSIIILAIMLIAGMAFYFNAQQGFRWSVNKRIAVEIASADLEYEKNSDYATLPHPAPINNPINNISFQKSVSVSNIDANGDGVIDYKQLHVIVSWSDPGKSVPSRISLDTYIAP